MGGLYLDYAVQAFYDAISLLIAAIMVAELGGMDSTNVKRHQLSALWACAKALRAPSELICCF